MPVNFQPPPQMPYGGPAMSIGPGAAPNLSQASPLAGASQAVLGGQGGGGGGPGTDPGNSALMQALIAQRMKAKAAQAPPGMPGTMFSPTPSQAPGMRLINSVSGLPNFDQTQPQPAPQQ